MSVFWNSVALAVAAGVVAANLLTPRLLRAQSNADALPPTPSSTYTLRLSAADVAAYIEAARRNLNYLPGQVVVKFKGGVTAAGQTRALSGLRDRPTAGALEWRGPIAVLRDTLEPDANILARQLRLQPEVEYAHPNYLSRPSFTPNDTSFSSRQWNFTALDLPRAWDITTVAGAGKDVIVAVIDTGITTVNEAIQFRTWDGTGFQNVVVNYATNPDLAAARLVAPTDLVFWTGPVLDMDGHGTHVSGTIAEDTDNSRLEAGIAFNARIMPVKVCLSHWDVQFTMSALNIPGFAPSGASGCPDSAIAQGIRYAADNGAKVINLSLGGPDASQATLEAIKYAIGKGVFVAAAAGNGFEKGNVAEFPAAHAPDLKGLVSVGAVGRSLRRSFFSTTGSYVELTAPGGDSRDGGAAGQIWQATLEKSTFDPSVVLFPQFNSYVETPFQGTSMSTPHVSGTAALLIARLCAVVGTSANCAAGTAPPAAVETMLEITARDLGNSGRDDDFGFGLIQPRAALFGLGIRK